MRHAPYAEHTRSSTARSTTECRNEPMVTRPEFCTT
jgi:hypothetical protein